MHRVDRSLLVPYSAAQMFDLVADVARYPEFLPWCSAARVAPMPGDLLRATVRIDYRGVHSEFTTENRHVRAESIRLRLLDGPFRRLDGEWRFRALRDDACKVQLHLQYQFAAGLLGRAIAPVFDAIASSLIDAFQRRAEALHGG